MIERQTINGRKATVAYFGDNFVPMDKVAAPYAKVVFDDGEVLVLRKPEDVSKRRARLVKRLGELKARIGKYRPDQLRDERGRWAIEYHGDDRPEHDITGVLASGEFHVNKKDRDELQALIDAKDNEAIARHPALLKAQHVNQNLPETHLMPGYDTPEWRAHRQFTNGIIGYNAAVDTLIDHALSYSEGGPVRSDRVATILLGPPASGKSAFAEKIAAQEHAAIIDADDAKKIMPEFRKGIGSNAVHEESSLLAAAVQARLMPKGTNMLFPKVGGNPASIVQLTKVLKAHRYRVNIVNMDTKPDEAFRRATGRFLGTGRVISKVMSDGVDGNPRKTYDALKNTGGYEQVVNIDNNYSVGEHVITEGQNTEIGRILAPRSRR